MSREELTEALKEILAKSEAKWDANEPLPYIVGYIQGSLKSLIHSLDAENTNYKPQPKAP
jgi:hypothetical protein